MRFPFRLTVTASAAVGQIQRNRMEDVQRVCVPEEEDRWPTVMTPRGSRQKKKPAWWSILGYNTEQRPRVSRTGLPLSFIFSLWRVAVTFPQCSSSGLSAFLQARTCLQSALMTHLLLVYDWANYFKPLSLSQRCISQDTPSILFGLCVLCLG